MPFFETDASRRPHVSGRPRSGAQGCQPGLEIATPGIGFERCAGALFLKTPQKFPLSAEISAKMAGLRFAASAFDPRLYFNRKSTEVSQK